MANNFEDVSISWIEEKKQYVKLSTICIYQTILQGHLIPYFGGKDRITEESVQNFVLQKLKDGLSQKSVKDMVVVIKMIAHFAQKKKLMEVEILDITFPENGPTKKIKVMSKAEEKRLIHYLKENFNFENLGILCCLQTGLRIGEICGLRWGDIDLETNEIAVNRTIERIYLNRPEKKTELIISEPKTSNSKRRIPICCSLMKFLKPLKRIANDSFYVVTNSLTPMEPRVYRKHFNKILKEQGFAKMKFHGLRHTFATRCIESKADYKTVSSILGHASITTTLNLYVHPSSEEKKKCIDRMMKAVDNSNA